MPTHKRLKRLLDIAETQRDQAAHTLSTRMKQQVEAQKQLEKLKNYTKEYRANHETSSTATSLQSFINHRQFIEKLSDAQIQQAHKIKLIQREMAPHLNHWIKAKNRCDAIHKSIQKSQQETQEKEEQNQQLDLDAYAARAMLANSKA